MNIVVTGGAGFIGSHLVDRLLADNHQVTVIDKSQENIDRNLKHIKINNLSHEKDHIKVICADITKHSITEFFDKADACVHLAALADIVPSIEDPLAYHRTNVDGTVNVLEAARHAKVKKFIYAASGSCYGNRPTVPTQETSSINPQYPYALTKYIGEQYAMHWNKVYKLPVISLRFFNVYGPRSRTTGAYGAVFGVFLAQKLAKKPFTIVGSGSQSRDFIYVTDAVDAIVAAIHSDKSAETYNIGSGQHSSINNLVNLIGPNQQKVYIPWRPGEPDV